MINIKQSVTAFVTKHGIPATAELTGKPSNIVAQWGGSKNPSLEDIQTLINKDPALFGDVMATSEPIAPYQFESGKRVCILMPTNRPIHAGVLKSFATLYEREKMQFYTSNDTSIVRARNFCAQKFLDSGCEYSFWLDDDTIIPHGDVEYYRKMSNNPSFPAEYVNINPIARLIQTGRSLVGGCYFGRNPNGVAQFQEAYQSNQINDAAHSGPRNFVNQVGWVGFGCTLVHRQVFLDMIAKIPDLLIEDAGFVNKFGYRYRFFNHISEEHSEDASFCIKAKKVDHSTYVDYAVMPIHMGEMGYCYHNTNTKKAYLPQF